MTENLKKGPIHGYTLWFEINSKIPTMIVKHL